MKRTVLVRLDVEHDDNALEADVAEAVKDAVKHLSAVAAFLPTLKGKSTRGREVKFKVRAAALAE